MPRAVVRRRNDAIAGIKFTRPRIAARHIRVEGRVGAADIGGCFFDAGACLVDRWIACQRFVDQRGQLRIAELVGPTHCWPLSALGGQTLLRLELCGRRDLLVALDAGVVNASGQAERRYRRRYRGRPCTRSQLGSVVIHDGFHVLSLIWVTWLRTAKSAYAHNTVRMFTYQCSEVHQFVALWLPIGQVARHAKQFASQMSGLLRPKTTFEAGLRSCPVSNRLVKLRRPPTREYDPQSPIALPFGRSRHKAAPVQRLKCPHQGRSVHHHRPGQLGHRQARTAAQRPENAELRWRDAGLGQITLVKLRNVPRGLPEGETVVALKII
jgi:hypothetical protein